MPAGQLLPVPEGVSLVDAAALPEVVCTVWSNVFLTANLQPGETLLVHGGSSGIGTMAIQLAREVGRPRGRDGGVGRQARGVSRARGGGARQLPRGGLRRAAREATDGHGADVILDIIGAKYLSRNVSALATNGRLVIIGMQGGTG